MDIYARVLRGVKWHAFEAVTYQTLLCSHRLILYNVIGSAEFGALGCIFAAVYGLVFLANLGFNDSLTAFFSDVATSQYLLRRFMIQQGLPYLCILISIPFFVKLLPFNAVSSLSFNTFIVASILFFGESLRITLRSFLQLTFINRELTYIDLGGLLLYLICVWSAWLYGITLTTYMLLLPLSLISCMQVVLLMSHAAAWYKSLPHKTTAAYPSQRRILRVRLFSYLHHSFSSHFMSNIIVPYSAYVWGLEYATIAKLLASVSQLITTILKHTIGFSSMALFSHLKHASDAEKQSIFHSIHRYLFTALFLSILLSGLIYHVAAHYLFTLQAHTVVIVLFLAVLTIENCFIACESAYLAEERSHAFALLSIIGVGAAYGLFHYQLINHVVIMLTTFIALRLASLSILSIMLTNRWKVPAYKEK